MAATSTLFWGISVLVLCGVPPHALRPRAGVHTQASEQAGVRVGPSNPTDAVLGADEIDALSNRPYSVLCNQDGDNFDIVLEDFPLGSVRCTTPLAAWWATRSARLWGLVVSELVDMGWVDSNRPY